jgi:signal peptidase II
MIKIPKLAPIRQITLVCLVSIFIIVADQWSKIYVRQNLQPWGTLSYLGGFFQLQRSENTGAFLSLGANHHEDVRFWVFTVGVGVFLLALMGYLFVTRSLSFSKILCFSFLLGGGVGNLIDRATRGSVTDFMILAVGPVHTGIFNIADMAITSAVIYLLFDSFFTKEEKS